jgi:hypothetical protein
VTACIDLALVYKCDPYIFLDRAADEVDALYRATSDRLREQAED